MDPAHPEAAALVIDGTTIAAVLRDAGDAPIHAQRVDLAGPLACSPASPTPTCTSRPGRSPAASWTSSPPGSLAEAVALVAPRRSPQDGWLRGRGWRDELWPPGDAPDRTALDAVTGDTPAALRAHDSHSLWLNTAALARAGGDLETPGGVVERDADGEPTGILREEAAWRFEARFAPTRAETLDAMRAALPAVAAAGVVAVHDKDGGRGAPELFAALRDAGELTVRVWQSIPATALTDGTADAARASAARGLREGVHGRHARLAHRAAARRDRGRDHVLRGARRDRPRRRGRAASPSPCTRSATAPTGRRSTRSRRRRTRGARSGCATGSSTRSACTPTTSRASRSSA